VYQRVAACGFRGLAKMHAVVSGATPALLLLLLLYTYIDRLW
jgi:hypothetical protein